ncbi:MAG: glycosyltransferase [Pseudomonadota bacterium]
MAKKPVILLTLCESLSNAAVVSQALGHARVMADTGVGTFHILAMTWNAAMRADAENFRAEAERLSGAPVRLVRGWRPAAPGSSRINGARIAQAVRRLGISFTHVHARTDYSAAVSARAAQVSQAVLIWDCRGDAVAELDFRASGLVRRVGRRVIESRLARAARQADRAVFVSHALRRRMAGVWPADKPAEVIPSVASDRLFFFDPRLRDETRGELGLAPQTPLYLYSGGLAPYQKFPETLDIFRRLQRVRADARLLVLTADTVAASALACDTDGVVVRSVANVEVNRYLNAADAAFMLRDKAATNLVASPTKFAEYCLAGLPVVMTDAVADSYALAREGGNLVNVEDGSIATDIPAVDRKKIAEFYRGRLSREATIEAYRRLYA